jgi:hypothetical protein
LSPTVRKVHDICEVIVEARRFLKEEQYEDILEMNRRGRFEFNVTFKGPADKRAIEVVKEEVELQLSAKHHIDL